MNEYNQEPQKKLKIGEALSASFATMNNQVGSSIGFLVIFFISSFLLNLIPFVNVLSTLFFSPQMIQGFPLAADAQKRKGLAALKDFFGGFKYAGSLALYVLFSGFIMLIVAMPILLWIYNLGFFHEISLFQSEDPEALLSLLSTFKLPLFLVMLLFFIVSIFLFFGPNLIVFQGYSAWQSLVLSFKLGSRHFVSIFLSFLLSAALSILGIICLLVGLLYFIPVTYYLRYHLFVQATGWGAQDEAVTANLVTE